MHKYVPLPLGRFVRRRRIWSRVCGLPARHRLPGLRASGSTAAVAAAALALAPTAFSFTTATAATAALAAAPLAAALAAAAAVLAAAAAALAALATAAALARLIRVYQYRALTTQEPQQTERELKPPTRDLNHASQLRSLRPVGG